MLLNATAMEAVEFAASLVPEKKAPIFMQPNWWDDPTFEKNWNGHLREIVKAYVTGTFREHKEFMLTRGNHIYSVRNSGTEFWLYKDNPVNKFHVCMAKIVNGIFIGNGSSIQAQKIPGKKKLHFMAGASRIQHVLGQVMPMVPFRLFEEHNLSLDCLRMIEKGKEEWLDVDSGEKDKPRHFTGAMVFSMPGVDGEEHFLFDVDRNDLAMKQFNAFMSKLCRPVTSIQDAYASLKPQEVIDAERFLDDPCPRQGEWFFIPVTGEFKKDPIRSRFGSQNDMEARLQSQGNRPHYVAELSEENYVRGKVTHGGHEHRPIRLKGWHKPVPNTAVESFTVSGDID